MMQRANIGCGQTPTPGWMNFDNSPSVRLASIPLLADLLAKCGVLNASRYQFVRFARENRIDLMDAARRWPLADDSLEVVYSSHMIEHFDRSEASRFLREAFRVLKPAGVLRLAAPDLRRLIESYNERRDANDFVRSLHVCVPRAASLSDRLSLFLHGSRNHNWMYDEDSLVALVSAAGFVDVRSLRPGETIIQDPGPLNLRERDDESLYVEARKPSAA